MKKRVFENLQDFQNKLEPCKAGEMLVSVKRDHIDTEHFAYADEKRGHHYYHKKA